jgi:hypothetical protein
MDFAAAEDPIKIPKIVQNTKCAWPKPEEEGKDPTTA